MTREDLISTGCRFYKGEKDNPFKGDEGMLWFYERCWVEDTLTALKRKDLGGMSDHLGDYLSAGLREFSDMDDVPITLKAYLFNRYAKTCYSLRSAAEPFKAFYLRYYGRK